MAGLTFMLMVGLCPGGGLRAADAVPPGSPASTPVTASLEFKETPYIITSQVVPQTRQATPFAHEPAAAGNTTRGFLNLAGSGNAIPFLWQRTAGKLYLNLNHRPDFSTNAPGVTVAHASSLGTVQMFNNLHLPFVSLAGERPLLADLEIYDLGSQPYVILMVRSFWQGRVTLSGRDWQVGLVPNTLGSSEEGRLLLRSWERRERPFTIAATGLDTIPFSRKLFLDGHAYGLKLVTNAPAGAAGPALQFAEQSVALGDLKITGQFIQRLVLPDGPYLVVLDQPAGVVKIPTGNYGQPDVLLARNGTEAYSLAGGLPGGASYGRLSGGRISVDEKAPAELTAGGPLTNGVTASRSGEELVLSYHLTGIGGETYQLANDNRTHPPEFAIRQGARKIASGQFEFG
jgi:hypothetical protein